MAFGFVCFELDGTTQQNIAAMGTPAFVRELPPDLAPSGGSRCWFQAVAPGVAPYASTVLLRPVLVAGLAGASPDFLPVNFSENASAPAPTITVNAAGEIAQLAPLPASLLAPGVVAAVRVTFTGGVYCDVQGTIVSVAAALAAGGGGTVGIVGPLATVYVEPPAPLGRGSDVTGQRGDASRPFATLTGAFGAMQSGDTMVLASGTYAPPAGPVPAALTDGVIRAASGATSTIIDAQGTGLPGLDFGGASRGLWRLEGFHIAQDPGARALSADGSAAPAGTYFVNGSLACSNVVITGGDVFVKYAGTFVGAFTVGVSGGLWRFETCGTVFFASGQFLGGESMEIATDNDDPLSPTLGASQLGPVRFDGACVFVGGSGNAISCSLQGGVYAAPGSVMPQINGIGLTKATAGPGWFSQLTVLGSCESIDFTNIGAFPDVQGVFDLRGANVNGQCNIAQTPGAVNTLQVAAGGAVFGSSVSIGEGCRADVRTSSFAGGILAQLSTAGSNGRVLPPTFATFPELVQVPPLVSSFALPFRLDSLDYAIALDYDSPGDAPGFAPAAGRTTTSFDVLSSTPAPSAGTVRAIVSFYGA